MKYFLWFCRIVVGGTFIVSGLVKANDPLGFSYKLEEYFANFLKGLAPDAIKAECLLPVFVDELMHKGELTVPMLTTDAVWFGVTYKEDKPFVQAELRKLHESGVYPASLHE